ncbi:hypothetical protein GCM10007304_42480 [Rhodococcoides trifolii]|uniref:Uncharacterized protein n=2 Tax=Rhodococcoides trifolii TaxID=908250 RepID=A0A917G608_9NOCA|nr:hypothetical protein GCM10007304_42480 [Rhodococcus trifolii]
MWRQALGFAVFGIGVALLGAALGSPTSGWTAYVSGASLLGDASGPWASQVTTATVGAAVGLFVGVVLYGVGIRALGPDGGRIGRVASAGTVGAAVGLSPALFYVGSAFVGSPAGTSVAVSYGTILVLYVVSALLAYGCAVGAVRLTMAASADPLARRTTRAVALVLPIGGILATAAGVGAAWLRGFSTTVPTLVAVVVTVVLVLAATFALARGRVLARETVT